MSFNKKTFIIKVDALCQYHKLNRKDLFNKFEIADVVSQQWAKPDDHGPLSLKPQNIVALADKLNVSCDYLLNCSNEWINDIYEDFISEKDDLTKLSIIIKYGLPYNYPDVAVYYFSKFKNKLPFPVLKKEEYEIILKHKETYKLVAFGGDKEESQPPIEEKTT